MKAVLHVKPVGILNVEDEKLTTEKESEVNARLIAMAPAMYKICRSLHDNPYLDVSNYYNEVHEILKKIDLESK